MEREGARRYGGCCSGRDPIGRELGELLIDLQQALRPWLVCRGFAHTWDHGPAPVQVDDTQKPVVWVSRGHCTSCGMKRHMYLAPETCDPLSRWEYADINGMRRGMRLVTQLDARGEIARRDQVGQEAPPAVAKLERKRRKTG
jgi:hypothetical protein